MKIHVPSIPDEGIEFSFSKVDGWFRAMLHGRLAYLKIDPALAQARVALFRTNQNISLSGKLHYTMRPNCGRCGASFDNEMDLEIVRHLVPHFGGHLEEMLSQDEEIELSAEDLEFSFYHNDEIDLEEILAEEVLLALPMNYVCREDCQGLCPRCGSNWNEGACGCPEVKEESPFAVLKGLKVPR